ncbi:MAG: 4a-hydroxytetrahydrobiopterin dehydratase [Actinomycetota bacterium]
MERKKLSPDEILNNLVEMEDWSAENDILSRRFEFENFSEALEFINLVGAIAERRDHHPDITFGWGYAEINLTTHDRNGITALDFAVAKEIDGLV